jgi:hypothetical protein
MRARITRFLATSLLVFTVSPLQAEEYDVTINLRGDTPVPVLFLKCARNFDVTGTEEAPSGCRQREVDQTFSTTVARITNVGSSIVWIHIGRARLPVLPGKVFRHRRLGQRAFDRIFLSGEAGGLAHVFVADPVQDEPEAEAPKESERPKQGERIEKK